MLALSVNTSGRRICTDPVPELLELLLCRDYPLIVWLGLSLTLLGGAEMLLQLQPGNQLWPLAKFPQNRLQHFFRQFHKCNADAVDVVCFAT